MCGQAQRRPATGWATFPLFLAQLGLILGAGGPLLALCNQDAPPEMLTGGTEPSPEDALENGLTYGL